MQGTNADVSANERFYRTPGQADELARLPEWARRVSLVVLVNGASASSAELVAGALQDHGRAKVIGSQTFGKGSIQMVLPLPEGTAVKLTVARYYTPKGREIQAQGITPDVVVSPAAANMAANGVMMRESDLAHHLAPAAPTGASSAVDTVGGTGQRAAAENTQAIGTPGDKTLKVRR